MKLIVEPYKICKFESEKHRSIIIALIFLPCLTIGFLNDTKDNFSVFVNCIEQHNVKSSLQLVQNNSILYSYYNYQWNLYPYKKNPFAYVLPESESEVGIIIKCGVSSNISIVPKSGGHSFEKYSSGTSRNNVIIDLRRLKSVELKGNEAIVGGGTLSGYLNWNLWNIGKVMIPVGECPTVGVAGLTFGGGYNIALTRSLGLTQDFLKGFHIVTATGDILKVDANRQSDLFWAMRGGGGGNFGIVTQLKYSVTTPPNITFGTIQYPMDSFLQVYDTFQQLYLSDQTSEAFGTLSLEMLIRRRGISMDFFDTSNSDVNARNVLKLFPVGFNYTSKTLNFIDFVLHRAQNIEYVYGYNSHVKLKIPSDLESLNQDALIQMFHKRKSFFVYKKIGKSSIRKLYNFFRTMPTTQQAWLQPYGGAIRRYSRTATAFIHRGNSYLFGFPVSIHTNESNADHDHIQLVYQKKLDLLAKSIFKHNETYQNYIEGDLLDYGRRYYGENLERLIKIKRKYDPNNYFRFPQAIP